MCNKYSRYNDQLQVPAYVLSFGGIVARTVKALISGTSRVVTLGLARWG